MRILSLPINDDLLEIHNSMWSGEERIYFNGQLASKGASFFGRSHYFTVDRSDGDGVDKFRVEIGMAWTGGITIDVFRNDKCLLASNRTPLTRVEANFQDRGDAKPYHVKRQERDDPFDEDFFV